MTTKLFQKGDKVMFSDYGKDRWVNSEHNPHDLHGTIFFVGNEYRVEWCNGNRNGCYNDLDFVPYPMPVRKFKVGDTVKLSDKGLEDHEDDYENPHDGFGVVLEVQERSAGAYKIRWDTGATNQWYVEEHITGPTHLDLIAAKAQAFGALSRLADALGYDLASIDGDDDDDT